MVGIPIGRLRQAQQIKVEERQRAPRANIHVPLSIRMPSVDAVFATDALNISKSGMYIAVADPPAVGTHLEVELTVGKQQLLLHATVEVVRRVEGGPHPGVGVRFLDVPFEAQALVERMVNDERLFGDYKLEALIGRGGMAEVFRARALGGKKLGTHVAIKRIRPELEVHQSMVELFRQEAAIAGILRHPSIVEVYDIGQIEGITYIVMEHVEGCTLAQLIDACAKNRISVPIPFCCYIMKTVADALQHVHTACDSGGLPLGIVHRDVAPSNVFISKHGEVKLGDFGIAYVAALSPERPGTVVAGKDPYLAPEQLVGARVSATSDVFSLGAVLFELLTCRQAFVGNSAAIHKDIVAGSHPLPSAFRPEVPPALDAVVQRALSPLPPKLEGGLRAKLHGWKNRHRQPRFGSADELGLAVASFFEPAVANEWAIASMVRGLFGRP